LTRREGIGGQGAGQSTPHDGGDDRDDCEDDDDDEEDEDG
jgi:hypothetical protein